ncbi:MULTISPECIES: cobyrinic acid a,c-diamide synthase [unclassified Amycolatopsis]|uniref:cobyrinic acid a,c-diamide synthase n=1 Tax=unclassified Amycolatopsis TaxID=2618356 RepID=UPI002876379C|nr:MULTISPECIES: cobyrinic acid a,c-diamide synthase [unclassified Amycolatopsis]MDS0135565.1 cobyrinic acid a,c-diamide synthase [Amycolatopsis sp. 505]MDS0148419.1 cobyrinic acid a,c-diamide synthase [Amycolatopsis sp. CM201R]
MSRRASLPGASELFRITSSPALDLPPAQAPPEPVEKPQPKPSGNGRADQLARSAAPHGSGRTKHDAKITVYVSGDELVAMEQARLTLRAKHDLVVDRGRLVREAVAVLLADFDQNGDESVLVQRLRVVGSDGGETEG